MVSFVHTLLGIACLAVGAGMIVLPKGTRLHRHTGRVYVGLMTVLLLTSFGIFELFGGFGVFHAMSIISGLTLAAGGAAVLLRSRIAGWVEYHYHFMLWSYLGLVMATNSHFFEPFERLLAASGLAEALVPIVTAGALWGVPFVIGAYLIQRTSPRLFTDIVERQVRRDRTRRLTSNL